MKWLLLIGLLIGGCSTGGATPFGAITNEPPAAIPAPECPMPGEVLTAAVDGLLWTSESDYPWEYWDLPEAGPEEGMSPNPGIPTVEEFLVLIDAVGEPVEVRELDAYLAFASTLREDMTPEEVQSALQYQELIQTLKATYPDGVVVYKVGTIQVNVFIVGIACGRPSGIRTLSIET